MRSILSILNADVLKSPPYAKPGDCTENDSVCSVSRLSFVDSALSGKHAQPTRYSRHRRHRLHRPAFDSVADRARSSGARAGARAIRSSRCRRVRRGGRRCAQCRFCCGGVAPGDTVIHLVGTPHPSPSKADQFEKVDLVSIRCHACSAARRVEIGPSGLRQRRSAGADHASLPLGAHAGRDDDSRGRADGEHRAALVCARSGPLVAQD